MLVLLTAGSLLLVEVLGIDVGENLQSANAAVTNLLAIVRDHCEALLQRLQCDPSSLRAAARVFCAAVRARAGSLHVPWAATQNKPQVKKQAEEKVMTTNPGYVAKRKEPEHATEPAAVI